MRVKESQHHASNVYFTIKFNLQRPNCLEVIYFTDHNHFPADRSAVDWDSNYYSSGNA